MSKKVGTLIKKARTDAGLTQAQLAKKVTGCTTSDIGKAERGEKDLTQAQLRQIAKATGVTQASLINAAKGSSSSSSSTSSTSASSFRLTKAEKELVQKYRKSGVAVQTIINLMLDNAASSGSSSGKDDGNILQTLLGGGSSGSGKDDGNILQTLLGGGSSGSGKNDDLVSTLISLLGKK